tara:strand:- start:966 stop:1256 length:291 start_codon:yes stop_codon:yes gene_type:complete
MSKNHYDKRWDTAEHELREEIREYKQWYTDNNCFPDWVEFDKHKKKQQKELDDILWLKRMGITFVILLYLSIGLYWYYPEVLNMLFWPFHYGWFAH